MKLNFSSFFSSILFFIDDQYRITHEGTEIEFGFFENNFERIMKIAEDNKVSYLFLNAICKEFPEFKTSKEKLIEDNENEILKVAQTLEFLYQNMNRNNLDFMLIKTLKVVPFITRDVDIVVKDVPRATKILKESGAHELGGRFINVLSHLNLGSPGFQVNGLLSVDVYDDIPFSYLKAMDSEFLWFEYVIKRFRGRDYVVPSPEADLIITIGSPLFTDRKLTYLDFLHIEHLLRMANMEIVDSQLKKYGWKKEFDQIINIIKNTRRRIVKEECFPTDILFPYQMPDAVMIKGLSGPIHATMKACPASTFNILSNVLFHCFFGKLYIKLLFL